MGQIQSILRIEEGTWSTCEGRNMIRSPTEVPIMGGGERGGKVRAPRCSTVPPFHRSTWRGVCWIWDTETIEPKP